MTKNRTELIRAGVDITVTLTDEEEIRLQECEAIIKADLNTFMAVGRALAEIHDDRLYRKTHKTFEKYCKDVWDLGQSTAYQKIDGYNAVALLEQKSSAMAELLSDQQPDQEKIIIPVNERQARPLTKLKKNPDDQVKAWEIVIDQLNQGKKLTASLVNKAVKQVRGEVVRKKKESQKKELESTQLVSGLFKSQIRILTDVINGERNSGWKTTSRKEAVKWLKNLIKLVTEDN